MHRNKYLAILFICIHRQQYIIDISVRLLIRLNLFAGDCDYLREGSCYITVNDLLTFDEATARCQSMGADLVEISNKAENNFVRGLAKSRLLLSKNSFKNTRDQALKYVEYFPV